MMSGDIRCKSLKHRRALLAVIRAAAIARGVSEKITVRAKGAFAIEVTADDATFEMLFKRAE